MRLCGRCLRFKALAPCSFKRNRRKKGGAMGQLNRVRRRAVIATFAPLAIAMLCAIGGRSALGGTLYGAGTISCAEWQKYRTSDDRPNTFQAEAWVDGYLSGYNSALDNLDILASRPS